MTTEQKTWESMDERERDRWIALNVLGWEYRQFSPDWSKWYCRSVGDGKGWWKAPGGNQWLCQPCLGIPNNYSADVDPDYAVLEHVRQRWGQPLMIAFEACLARIWQRRQREDVARFDWGKVSLTIVYYEPGDYSHAAFLAKTEVAE